MIKRLCLFLFFAALTLNANHHALAQSPTIKPALHPPLTDLPGTFPKIDRKPAPATWNKGKIKAIPAYNPDSNKGWQVDLRASDLSGLDLNKSIKDLMYADFDSRTIWPPADKMPKDFNWKHIMDLGKNPGLGIRQLHENKIDGYGVGIAIIDQTLLVDHQEYSKQLRFYEETSCVKGDMGSAMHGPAVASIAVGKTIGVAPGADLYYIGTNKCSQGSYETIDFACLAQSVTRILEVNKTLPQDRKIRVISISVGWRSTSRGYAEITAATKEAVKAGMLVICSCVENVHGVKFHGLGRAPLANPDQFDSYEPGIFWAKDFYKNPPFSDRLLVPMDSRTTAGPGGIDEYTFYRDGGWSWSIPYIAGMYALAAQVKPTITPDEFWRLALQTGRTIQHKHEGTVIPFGPILDPIVLIAALQK